MCSVVGPIILAEFPTQSSRAVSLSTLITLAIADFHFGPGTPGPIFDLLAEGQVPLAVGLYQLVAQSLASVGLLDILDTELGFLVYRTEKKFIHRIRLSGLNISFYLKRP